jgi:hypothetical protein
VIAARLRPEKAAVVEGGTVEIQDNVHERNSMKKRDIFGLDDAVYPRLELD